MRFFDACLKDIENGVRDQKMLYYYTMGEEKWKRTNCWPPHGVSYQRWYMAENHELSTLEPDSASGADHYKIDLNATTGTQNRWWELVAVDRKTVYYGDRAEADHRLLTYTSPVLDHHVEITGYPIITLYVTSTATDGAFFAYLEDVCEDGTVRYITEGLLRAIHRKVSPEIPPYLLQVPYHSFKREDLMPLIPGEVAELTFGLLPTSVLIRKGHRIRVAIAGHDQGTFPRIPSDHVPEISVLRNRLHASYIDLPSIER
jgi:putative CocE/NonD family hydrolase